MASLYELLYGTSNKPSTVGKLVGLLRDKTPDADPYRAALGGLLSGDTQPLRGLLNTPVQMNPQQINQDAYDLAMNFGPMGVGSIKAFHGSPHQFDNFDMSKIGTGEGAQAYGHGLYFADSPEVAGSYSGKLSSELFYNGKPMARESAKNSKDSAAWALYLANGNKEVAKKSGLSTPEMIDRLNPGKLKPGGNMYEVSLRHPDPAKEAATPLSPADFLQWDKPLSEQPPSVANAIKGNLDTLTNDLKKSGLLGDYTPNEIMQLRGEDYYDMMRQLNAEDQVKATNYLKSQGIPGIRYLDGGSRGAGQGTYNYVVFDDQIPKIVKRTGGGK